MLRRHKTQSIDPLQALELQRRGAVILDVREDDEWTAGHAPDAEHVPLARVSEAADRFVDRDLLTVCRSGIRSGRAAKVLAAAGVNVRNVAGGMSSWAAAGLPVVRSDGSPGRVA
jgi:rhodanese-related sulfurtransferase